MVPLKYRAEIVQDLADDHAASIRQGRSRFAADVALMIGLIRSAADSRRLTPATVRPHPFRGVGRDVAYAWRRTKRSPGVSTVAVLTLALGIGSTAAIFGLVNAVLLKTAPIPDSDRVVAVRYADASDRRPALSYVDYRALSTNTAVFSETAAVLNHGTAVTANGAGQGEPVQAEFVSPQYFRVLGQRPLAGALEFPVNELQPTLSVILSETVWRRWFNGDRAVIGRTVNVSRVPLTIVGVVPGAFKGVRLPTIRRTDLWLPLGMAGQLTKPPMRLPWENPAFPAVMVFARLRDGIDSMQARAVVGAVARQFPRENLTGPTFSLTSADEVLLPAAFRRTFGPISFGFIGLAALVLLIACGNLANLLLARSIGRRHEMAVRLATGATRWRLVRLSLTETGLTTAVALLLGLFAGSTVSWMLAAVALPPFDGQPVQVSPTLDWRVVGFSAGVAALAALLVGAGPAWRAAQNQAGVLNNHAPDAGAGGRRLRALLVSGQVAACTVLLIVAGLYVRSAVRALQHDPGFDLAHTAMARLDLGASGSDQAFGEAFLARAITEAGRLPGVRHAAVADVFPLGDLNDGVALFAEPTAGDPVRVTGKFARVSPALFDAMHISILRGRPFAATDVDGSPPVAIVSEYTAQRLWPGQDPIGKRIALGSPKAWQQVVGIARDTDVGLPGRQGAMLYLAFAQRYMAKPVLIVEGSGHPNALIAPLREALRRIDPDVAIASASTVAEDLSVITLPVRAVAGVSTVLGTIGLLLALLGLYGTVTYTVRARTREIGIRVALGASATDVRTMVLRQSLAMLVGGAVPGMILAAAGVGGLRHMFVGVETHDPLTFVAVPILLILIGVAAAYLPGRHAARIDPTVALRQ
jgi:predicted permease